MRSTNVLLIGNRRDLAPVETTLGEQFPDLRCELKPHGNEAFAALGRRSVRLIIFLWNGQTGIRGFQLLRSELRRQSLTIPVIVISEANSSGVMLSALRDGAVDVLSHPINYNRLSYLVGILTSRQASSDSAADDSQDPTKCNAHGETPIVFESHSMRLLVDSLRMAARADATILLTGETGTGKNHLAQFTHAFSPRRHQPLVTVDCGASSEHLIESDLFGHRQGAFTGADRDHVGKLERVGSGTVLLDEIDSLPMASQSRLLRALEERVFEKLGGDRTQRFQGRVIALTNKVLEDEVAEKRFRQDLYYRLNVIAFSVPPLRERPRDIAPLAKMFIHRITRQSAWGEMHISEQAMALLESHPWLGNARELRNVLERAAALNDSDTIQPQHLKLPASSKHAALRPRGPIPRPSELVPRSSSLVPRPVGLDGVNCKRLAAVRNEAERRELKLALEEHGNNRTQTARHLGISRSALYKRLGKLDLP